MTGAPGRGALPGLQPAVFLDRDGTLNPDPGYIADPALFTLYPETGPALMRLQRAGFVLVLITNQSGVGRGLITETALDAVHARMTALLGAHGVALAGIYVCPHRPDERCVCRKPAPTMILRAAADLGLDLGRSWMVGDKEIDVRLGLAAGVTPLWLARQAVEVPADLATVPRVADLGQAAATILKGGHEEG